MRLNFMLMLVAAFMLVGCSDENSETASGWHFQGRDCLSCHNTNLKEQKNLLVGGTLYRSSTVNDVDSISEVCDADFVVNFLDSSYATQISSKDYEDIESAGYEGKGNVFVLSKYLDTLNGDYYMQIVDRTTNKTLAQSTALHSFNSSYSNANSTDVNNQNSCNSCHAKGGVTMPIHVQVNQNLCK